MITDRHDGVAQPRGRHIGVQTAFLRCAALLKTVLAELLHVPLVMASQARHAVDESRRTSALIRFERNERGGHPVFEGHLAKVGSDFDLFDAPQKANHRINQIKMIVQADSRI